MQHSLSSEKTGQAKDHRAADRFVAELPIELNGVRGLTRNISATGVYFESVTNQAPGSVVQFAVDVEIQGEKFKMICKGEVVRVDHKDATVGIAVKLAHSFFTDPEKFSA